MFPAQCSQFFYGHALRVKKIGVWIVKIENRWYDGSILKVRSEVNVHSHHLRQHLRPVP